MRDGSPLSPDVPRVPRLPGPYTQTNFRICMSGKLDEYQHTWLHGGLFSKQHDTDRPTADDLVKDALPNLIRPGIYFLIGIIC